MAYIGIDPNVGDISFQTFTGDGSTTAFTLAQSVASGEAIIVTIGNVVQEPGASAAYTAYANTLTFSAAPVNGDVITVRYFGRAVDQPLSYGMQLFKYVATASQTVFTGADSSGTVLAFSGTDVDVYLNGVHLDAADFTASSGDTITLAVGAALNDELVIRAFRAFTITDTVSASSGGTFNGAVTFDAGATFGDNDKAIFGAGNDLQIYHTGANSWVQDAGTGNLILAADNLTINSSDGTEYKAQFATNGAVTLYHDNAAKLATTATGVDVTGLVKTSNAYQVWLGANVLGSDGGLTSIGANPIVIGTDGQERLRIDSSGNVGIGTSSPTGAKLHVVGGVKATDLIAHDTSGINLQTSNGTKRLIVDNSGSVRINATSDVVGGGEKLSVATGSGSGGIGFAGTSGTILRIWQQGSGSGTAVQFYSQPGGSFVGSITVTTSSTSYNTSSDYRLKTAVNYDWDATTRLKQLRPARFEWISDGDDAVPVDGFLAHEVQDVVPEAITGTHDEVDDDGNPVYQGIDQSKLTPLLTKALIEAVEKIEQLEARIAALEAN